MPNINDRIGSQNVIRVLSNASAPPTKLINLTDVDSTLKDIDGLILVWDVPSDSFIMTSTIDRSTTVSDSTNSNSTSTGAFVVGGGVGIGANLNVGGDLRVSGVSTFGTGETVTIDGDNNFIRVGSGVTIDSELGIFTPSINIDDSVRSDSLFVVGFTTLASNGSITTTGGDLYVGKDAYISRNLRVDGTSEFIGVATFRGGTINLGDSDSDDINVSGEFISNLVPNADALYDLGIQNKRWRNARFSGLVTTRNLSVTDSSTFLGDLNINSDVRVVGFVSVTEGLYYDSGDYDGPNGVAYFDNTGRIIGAASTENSLTETYFVLTTNSAGTPYWSSVIDGGEF